MALSVLALLHCGISSAVHAAGTDALTLNDAQRAAVGIRVEPVRSLSAEDLKPAQGGTGVQLSGRVVVPNSRLDVLLARSAGRVESILVNSGDRVRTGQVVARLHSAELLSAQRAYLAARSQAELTAARSRRDESLHGDGVIAESRLESTRMDLALAEASLREQRQLLRLAGMSDPAVTALQSPEAISPVLAITARRPGRVLQQSVQVGEQVPAGAALLTIAELDLLWIDLQATRGQGMQIAVGDRVELAGCAVAGRLIATGVQLDATSQTLTARAQFEGAGDCAAPNQFVQVLVAPARPAAGLVSVPASAIVHRAGKDYVFVEVAGSYRAVAVAVERMQSDRAWLRTGPPAGARVVWGGVAALKGRWMGLGTGGGR